jgi:hypothetical protein
MRRLDTQRQIAIAEADALLDELMTLSTEELQRRVQELFDKGEAAWQAAGRAARLDALKKG